MPMIKLKNCWCLQFEPNAQVAEPIVTPVKPETTKAVERVAAAYEKPLTWIVSRPSKRQTYKN